MMFGNEKGARSPSGYKVAPMSYAKLEEVADALRPLLPKTTDGHGWNVDCVKILEQMLPRAGYQYHVEEVSELEDCAAFTIPEHNLVVLRQDVYDNLTAGGVFGRSTVVHELSHIVLKHAVTLHRGAAPGSHQFYEDSEWQAKALTAAIMIPVAACQAAPSAFDLAHMCGVSPQAATYRIEQLVKAGRNGPKQGGSLFDDLPR